MTAEVDRERSRGLDEDRVTASGRVAEPELPGWDTEAESSEVALGDLDARGFARLASHAERRAQGDPARGEGAGGVLDPRALERDLAAQAREQRRIRAIERGQDEVDTDRMAIETRAAQARDPKGLERQMAKMLKATEISTGR